MNTNIRLVICDIDSTLVTSDHILTERTKKVIDKLHRNGIYFGIASGRPLDEISKRAKAWGFNFDFDVLISMNGSELWDGIHHKEFKYYQLKRKWIEEIMELMKPFDGNYYIYRNGYILCKKIDETMLASAKSSDKELVMVLSEFELYAEENAKIMFRVAEKDMPKIEDYIKRHPSPYYKGFKTQSTLMEFADRRISKAYALEKFCEMNEISLQDVMAFGDTTNDNEMLQCSGFGICMINGSDDTKAIAKEITEKSNDEDGFADYMEHYFLKTQLV